MDIDPSLRALTLSTSRKLLDAAPGDLEALWVRSFKDDVEAHDDGLQLKLVHDFLGAFVTAEAELTNEFGEPSSVGDDDCDLIPMSGVFRYSMWKIDRRQLYLLVAHEDRELPFLLMLATMEIA